MSRLLARTAGVGDPAHPGSAGDPLPRLHAVRAAFALAWAGAFAVSASTLDAASVTLLVLYPAVDAAAAVVDHRSSRSGRARGPLVVNVARGGDLVQDLAETLGADHRHRVHVIEVLDDSPLQAVVPTPTITISCYHHQGIGRLGKGLRPAGFAEDGTVEAVTLEQHAGWYLGVQWHPEDTAETDPLQSGLFRRFVQAADARRQVRRSPAPPRSPRSS